MTRFSSFVRHPRISLLDFEFSVEQPGQLEHWVKNPPGLQLRRKAWGPLLMAGDKAAYELALGPARAGLVLVRILSGVSQSG